jgi:hypothetical protein
MLAHVEYPPTPLSPSPRQVTADDQLDEEATGELLGYAQWLTAEEDEPLTEKELARVREGEQRWLPVTT